jgi:hypothetical protein
MAGISPELLVSQVRSTAPYVFDDPPSAPELCATEPARIVRDQASSPTAPLAHAAYFRLCLAAHYLTCATPVPTDVDNQIRKKLWPPSLPVAIALEMGQTVLESRGWRFLPLTSRASYGAAESELAEVALHGHSGEWFTVAAGAYAALGHYRAEDAKKLRAALLDAIADETEKHSAVFGSVWRARDGLGALRASVSIAHNFGDLDRVIVMWDLPFQDPLRLRFHGLTTAAFGPDGALRHQGRLWAAGELYKSAIDGSSMAAENHRHFALRKPRALRSQPALRVPVGPFFDAWGEAVASALDAEPLLEVVEALVHGQERLGDTLGYARALRAIALARPEHHAKLEPLRRKSPRLKKTLETTREDFEARWSAAALAHLEEIPSRAR